MKILVVEDEANIRQVLKYNLELDGYDVITANDGTEALEKVKEAPGLILLDIMMPRMGGLEVCKRLKKDPATSDIPIFMLTAKSQLNDIEEAFRAGADDYLPKPFEPKELLLRIHAILRRMPDVAPPEDTPKMLSLGATRYDVQKGELWEGDTQIRLTSTELELMRIFSKNIGQALSRMELVTQMGREDGNSQDRAIDVQITRLRKKIETNPKEPRYLQTVRGSGYMLACD